MVLTVSAPRVVDEALRQSYFPQNFTKCESCTEFDEFRLFVPRVKLSVTIAIDHPRSVYSLQKHRPQKVKFLRRSDQVLPRGVFAARPGSAPNTRECGGGWGNSAPQANFFGKASLDTAKHLISLVVEPCL